jgi:hypothetical protein
MYILRSVTEKQNDINYLSITSGPVIGSPASVCFPSLTNKSFFYVNFLVFDISKPNKTWRRFSDLYKLPKISQTHVDGGENENCAYFFKKRKYVLVQSGKKNI